MSKISLFVQRWARRKMQPQPFSASGSKGQAPAALSGDTAAPVAQAPAVGEPQPDTAPSPPLPAIDTLGPDSDFSAFLRPEVSAEARQAALKKLFLSDHYRRMDMLDVYVDDYSRPELLPAAMLAKLQHALGALLKPDASPAQAGTDVQPAPENGENQAGLPPDSQAAASAAITDIKPMRKARHKL